MKKCIKKDTFNKMKYQIILKTCRVHVFARTRYQKLNKRQRIVLFSGFGVIVLLIIIIGMSVSPEKTKSNNNYPVNFETIMPVAKQVHVKADTPAVNNKQSVQLQLALNQVKENSKQQYESMKKQLQTIQSNMVPLASQQNIAQLKQTLSQPNQTLLGKLDTLQNVVRKIVKQTAKKAWVDPKVVQKYFRLVAIQSFSDGMRAVIDIDGNQTTLNINEVCPACRGWTLQSMDFFNQSGVFVKRLNKQTFYVKLQAN